MFSLYYWDVCKQIQFESYLSTNIEWNIKCKAEILQYGKENSCSHKISKFAEKVFKNGRRKLMNYKEFQKKVPPSVCGGVLEKKVII